MNELTVSSGFLPAPKTLDEAMRIATLISESDMVPKDFKGKPGNCLIAMQWGADIGIPGIQALQNIAVINGRPSIWGDAAKAVIIGRSDCEDIQEFFEGEGDALMAVCVAKRRGKSPVTSKFGLADAKAAGLLGKQGPWTQYRNRMLMMRARGFALRDAFPDALRGLSIAEESQDIVIEKDIQTGETISSTSSDLVSEKVIIPECTNEAFSKYREKYSKAIMNKELDPDKFKSGVSKKWTLTDAQIAEITEWSCK